MDVDPVERHLMKGSSF